jgi:hypothetical protein
VIQIFFKPHHHRPWRPAGRFNSKLLGVLGIQSPPPNFIASGPTMRPMVFSGLLAEQTREEEVEKGACLGVSCMLILGEV